MIIFTDSEYNILKRMIDCTGYASSLYDDYSGRGMFDHKCIAMRIGFSVSSLQIFSIIMQKMLDVNDESTKILMYKVLKMVRDTREESEGLGAIIYWPFATTESMKDQAIKS